MILPDYKSKIDSAVESLSEQFPNLAWNFRPTPTGGKTELISQWLGDSSEDIMVVCFKGRKYIEKYHRQDFFFINFVCQNGYDVLSSKYDNHLHLNEGDCYIGQPFSGYALKIDSDREVIMVGLHIKKDLFYQHYLYPLSHDTPLFHFFLDPHTNRFSDEYIRLHIPGDDPVWSLLYQMLIEYAGKSATTQAVLRPMMLAITMHLSRIYQRTSPRELSDAPLSMQMIAYIESHSDSVTLRSLASHFRYHPNYVSRYLHDQTGKTFSAILLEKRMEKAALLLRNTDLSIEKIAAMLGYSNSSNFYKAFREYFHTSPRDFEKPD
ncbi:MAG: helix-turn-helix transcriptional regulator [Bilifractor sp.]|jgi:AraC-like DNA-binding protein